MKSNAPSCIASKYSSSSPNREDTTNGTPDPVALRQPEHLAEAPLWQGIFAKHQVHSLLGESRPNLVHVRHRHGLQAALREDIHQRGSFPLCRN
jgi:hypothetical protein